MAFASLFKSEYCPSRTTDLQLPVPTGTLIEVKTGVSMPLTHAQEEAASTEAVQAVLLTGDLFGVVWQHLHALRESPPPELFTHDFGFDRSAAAALRLVSRGMRDLVDSVVAQLAVPRRNGTGVSLESCLPRFAASLRDLTLQMQQFGDLRELCDLSSLELPHLEKLDLRGPTKEDSAVWDFPALSHVAAAKLQELRLSGASLQSMEAIGSCQALRLLSLQCCNKLRDLGCLRSCGQLQRLHLFECHELADLGDLRDCSNLTAFSMFECRRIGSLAALSGCSQLTYLVMADLDRVSDLTPLKALPLRSLSMGGIRSSPDVSALSALSQLTELRLADHWAVFRLVTLPQLQVLDIDGCKALTDLSPLGGCRLLEDVSMRSCTGVTSLAPLGGLPRLERLRMSSCFGVTDLVPLSTCTALRNLGIRRSGVSDLSPLTVLTNLVLFDCGDDVDTTPLHGLDIDGDGYESHDEVDGMEERLEFDMGN
ncbi:hypothetical protein FOA52_010205 [Chlamydomonas sp. UWO 241]|nr:hypothetical protein FOA52_010205 [Chlamydomonas sp. UWO 241]